MSLIQRIGTDAWRRYVENKPNFIDLETVPRQQIGTATNNTTFQDDGTMVLNGTATVFDDLTEDITRTKTVGTTVTVNDTELCIAMTDTSTAFAGADTYSGTVNVTSVDCHYEINSMGSKEEYVK